MRTIDYDRPQRGDDGRTKDGRPIVTREKYDAWVAEANICFDRYRCDQCGSIVWQTKTSVENVALPCGSPCRGALTKTGRGR